MGLFDFFRKPKPELPRPEPEQESGISGEAEASPGLLRSESALLERFQQEEGIPFPVMAVRGDRVEGVLLQLRTLLAPLGETPVIVGEREDMKRTLESWSEDSLSEVTLPSFDFETWLRSRREELDELPDDPDWLEEQGTVHEEGSAPMKQLQAGISHHGRPKAEVFIARLPVAQHWAAPLYLQYGGWNACPYPDAHAAMAHRWEQKFGARIAAMLPDTVEFTVERPPSTEAEAMELAWEMFYYCEDIVTQGVGTVATLAKALRRSTRWFFWWD